MKTFVKLCALAVVRCAIPEQEIYYDVDKATIADGASV